MQSIVQLPYNIYHALNKLRLGTRRSRALIKKCALITKVRLLTRFYGIVSCRGWARVYGKCTPISATSIRPLGAYWLELLAHTAINQSVRSYIYVQRNI